MSQRFMEEKIVGHSPTYKSTPVGRAVPDIEISDWMVTSI